MYTRLRRSSLLLLVALVAACTSPTAPEYSPTVRTSPEDPPTLQAGPLGGSCSWIRCPRCDWIRCVPARRP